MKVLWAWGDSSVHDGLAHDGLERINRGLDILVALHDHERPKEKDCVGNSFLIQSISALHTGKSAS
jgi:hypothetical protein